MIKSIYSNLLPKAVLLSVFLSPGYVISKAHANTDSISGIEQTNGKLSGRVICGGYWSLLEGKKENIFFERISI